MKEELYSTLIVNQNKVPTPSFDSTPISPPSFSTMVLQMDRPRPVPCWKLFSLTKRPKTESILSAGMLSFLGILDETATTVTFPILTREFAVTTDQVQWVNTLVLLVIATIVPISSQIRLRISTKHIFILGVLLFALGLIIDIITPRFDLLLLGRALQGVGTGIGLPLMYNIILTEVPKEKIGFMYGNRETIDYCVCSCLWTSFWRNYN